MATTKRINTNLHKKSLMDISIYHIEYVTTKSISDYKNITSVNPLYLIINDVDGYIEENDNYPLPLPIITKKY